MLVAQVRYQFDQALVLRLGEGLPVPAASRNDVPVMDAGPVARPVEKGPIPLLQEAPVDDLDAPLVGADLTVPLAPSGVLRVA